MKIYSIKSEQVMACAGAWAKVAEAMVENDAGEDVYVTMQDYDELSAIVARNSSFEYLAGDAEAPDMQFVEEFESLAEMKRSSYWPVIDKLRKVMGMLG